MYSSKIVKETKFEKRIFLFFCALVLILPQSLAAQFFSAGDGTLKQNLTDTKTVLSADPAVLENESTSQTPDTNLRTQALDSMPADVRVAPVEDKEALMNPEQKDEDEEPAILLFMDNFSINKTLNGSILCSMRFYVYSTLENPISELSFRLKWPEIETPVTFIGVKQKQPTYFDYALAGKGCYSMDKFPNIIVNRCRSKGISQPQCTGYIHWVK